MKRIEIHAQNPQPRLIRQVTEQFQKGALAALPTDASYVLACHLEDRSAVDRMRQLRGIDDRHLLTLMCRDLSELAQYAQVDNRQFRFLKEWTPGAYTFILPATKEVPKRLMHPSRKTLGLRVPDAPIIQALLAEMGAPLLCASLLHYWSVSGESFYKNEAVEILQHNATKKIEDKNTGISDKCFCHGTSGVFYMFHKISTFFGLTEFAETSQYWLNETLKNGDNLNSFKTLAYKNGEGIYVTDLGLIEGYVGMALSLLGFLDSNANEWEEIFML